MKVGCKVHPSDPDQIVTSARQGAKDFNLTQITRDIVARVAESNAGWPRRAAEAPPRPAQAQRTPSGARGSSANAEVNPFQPVPPGEGPLQAPGVSRPVPVR